MRPSVALEKIALLYVKSSADFTLLIHAFLVQSYMVKMKKVVTLIYLLTQQVKRQ